MRTTPKVGNERFTLHVQAGLGAAPALLLIGSTAAQIAVPFGTLAIEPGDPFLALPLLLRGEPGVVGAGVFDVRAPIPDDETLVGTTVYGQVLAADPGSSGGVSHSGGLALTLCE